jgi:hypothetical protein
MTATTTARRTRKPATAVEPATPVRKPRKRPAAAKPEPVVTKLPEITVKEHRVDFGRPGTADERDWTLLLEKDPQANHHEFVEYMAERGVEGLDVKTVQFVLAAYIPFQQSPEHKAKTQARRAAAAARKAEAEKNKAAKAE